MGTDQTGALEVPDGDTNNVGWYKRGTIPGNVGSAVFDAHVYAAFENLDDLEEGDKIYVITDKNELLRFSVEDAKTFKLSSLSSKTLFGNQGERGLNLITCAGKLTKDKSTYDHRLVVFTTLENAQSFGQRV
jgi:LPXTG-site transpeptidase (sortase) family protein